MSNIIKDSEVGVSESSDSSVSAVSSKLDNYSSGERSVMARFISGGISNRAMVVLMSIAGFSAQGCRADLLPPPKLTFAEGFVDADASDAEKADGTFVIDSFDIADAVDGGIDDSMDGITDDTISEIGEDVVDGDVDDAVDGDVDGDVDDAVVEVEDTTDAVDGGIDDAMDGITDDTISEIGEDVLDGDSDDVVAEVADITDEADGGVDDAMDGSTDDTILEVGGDVVDGSGDDIVAEVADITDSADGGVDDAMDGSTDDTILEVGGDVMDEDLNDIISEVVDSVDATEPLKTCDGKPVGTVQIIPTKGLNGEVGICVNGKEICSPVGVWEIQSAPVDPAIAGEICVDSLDNNCDGKTDEGPCDCDPDMDGLITDKIKDPNFLAALRILLKKGPNDPIALNEAQLVTFFGLSGKGISDISGIECFSNAEYLNLSTNSLLSIPQLQWLIKLKNVLISNNPMITSILPLVDNVGIGAGSMVYISGNKKIPLEQVKALEAKGVFVVNN